MACENALLTASRYSWQDATAFLQRALAIVEARRAAVQPGQTAE
jgi:hypothetical protein